MPSAVTPAPLVVSRESFANDDPYAIIESNIEFLNSLFAEHITRDEVASEALQSYYVDYYLAQVNNGGFSQFVYNSNWDASIVLHVRDGLGAMGAIAHLEVFRRAAAIVDRFAPETLTAYLDGDYFGEDEERDTLGEFDDDFFALAEREDLIALNAAWLRSLPALKVMSDDGMKQEFRRRVAAIPDRDARAAAARAAEPRYLKLIRALCTEAGLEFSHVTAGDPAHVHEGRQMMAFHFITNHGHHYMLELDRRALMFDGDSDACVAEIAVPAPV